MFNVGGIKLTDHHDVAQKYRDSAHWSFTSNLKLTKRGLVIFHNLKGYGSHLIMQEIGKFDEKLSYSKCIRKTHGFYN